MQLHHDPVPRDNYVDDYGSMEDSLSANSSFESFEKYNGCLQIAMKPSKKTVSVNEVDIPFFGWGSEAIERFSVYKQTRFAFNDFLTLFFPNMSS